MADVGCHQRPISTVLSIGRHWGQGHLRNALELLQLKILRSNRVMGTLGNNGC
jgi:hypothetical protein